MRTIPVDTKHLTIVAAASDAPEVRTYENGQATGIKVNENGERLVRVALAIVSDGQMSTINVQVPESGAPAVLQPLTPVTVEGLTVTPYIGGDRVQLSGRAQAVRTAASPTTSK